MQVSTKLLSFFFAVLVGPIAIAQVSSLTVSSTATTATYVLKYSGTPTYIQIFLDTDSKVTTGFVIGSLGANYMVENGTLYRYTGTSGAWGWTLIKTVTYSNVSGSATITVNRADIGNPSTLIARGDIDKPASASANVTQNFSTTTAPTIQAASSTATTAIYKLKYSGSPTYQKIYIDKDLNVNTGYKVGGIGADFLLQNTSLYKWSGSAWTLVKAITYSNSAGVATFTVKRVDIGWPANIKILGQVQDPIANTAVQTQALFMGTVNASCDFVQALETCDLFEQSKAPRATHVTIAGLTAIRLLTQPGDNNVFGSGTAERDDLAMDVGPTGAVQGVDQWWAHSVYFPTDYVVPPENPYNWGVVMDFHNSKSGAGQANIQLLSLPWGLAFWVSGGVVKDPQPRTEKNMDPIVKNRWYDFVYHIKWSSGSDGIFEAWVDGQPRMTFNGPTLYIDQNAYLKLANYHSALGKPVAVIHGRLIRGTGPIVSRLPLQ